MLVTLRNWWAGTGLPQRLLKATGPSLGEIVFTLAVSNLALLALIILWSLSTKPSLVTGSAIWLEVSAAVGPSEVLVYVMATLAAPLWLMLTRWRARTHVAFFGSLLIIQGLIVLTSALVFSVATLNKLQNPALASYLALLCFLLSVAIWLATLVYVKVWVDPAAASASPPGPSSDGNSLLDEMKRRKNAH